MQPKVIQLFQRCKPIFLSNPDCIGAIRISSSGSGTTINTLLRSDKIFLLDGLTSQPAPKHLYGLKKPVTRKMPPNTKAAQASS